MSNHDHHDASMLRVYDSRAPWFPDAADPSLHEAGLLDSLRRDFAGKDLLEIACGGGHFAGILGDVVSTYTGTDASPQRIEFARLHAAALPNARFHIASAYDLQSVSGVFNAALAVAWFSHVPTARHTEFLKGLHNRLAPGSVVYLIDEAANHPRAFQKDDGTDHYKRVTLADGSIHDIVDNAFSPEDYTRIVRSVFTDPQPGHSSTWTWARFVTP
jgi:cyclopropane fatty-acyl-phospholipid synthase-like methyltransferase